YGPRGGNFFLSIAGRATRGEPLRVVDDQSGTPTESRFVAEAATWALARSEVPEGLFHLAPRGQTTWCGFARAIVDRLHSESTVTAIPGIEYPTPARRPKSSVLDARAIETAIGLERPSWELLLDRCVADFNKAVAAP
ncbi:MAG: sugar nucleotide-binding protein, partial [Proteobacteria bacterium]|nr:sugar nucleotide-binding protein [Pseudomonadota bacterium]